MAWEMDPILSRGPRVLQGSPFSPICGHGGARGHTCPSGCVSPGTSPPESPIRPAPAAGGAD